MRTTGHLRAHYMKLGAKAAYCGIPTKRVLLAYDEWAKVTCSDCLAHPANPRTIPAALPGTDKENN